MENKFLYQLGKKLIFHASYREMNGILETYTQFSEEGPIDEKPKDIINSLYGSGPRALIFHIILGAFCIGNIWLFMYIDSHRHLSFSLQFIIPLVLSILFPLIVFIAVGNKITLLSTLYFGVKKNKILIFGMNILMCLVALIFYGKRIFNSLLDMRFIQNALCIVAILGIIFFGYLVLTRGVSYYLGLCSSYILICTLFQVKAIGAKIEDWGGYLGDIKIAFSYYLAAILLSVVWFTILKRKKY